LHESIKNWLGTEKGINGIDSQIIESWDHITHESHEEEWYLKNIFCNKVKAVYEGIIPCYCVERHKERDKPQQYFDPNDGHRDDQSNGEAS
jgi:hypothetical protein